MPGKKRNKTSKVPPHHSNEPPPLRRTFRQYGETGTDRLEAYLDANLHRRDIELLNGQEGHYYHHRPPPPPPPPPPFRRFKSPTSTIDFTEYGSSDDGEIDYARIATADSWAGQYLSRHIPTNTNNNSTTRRPVLSLAEQAMQHVYQRCGIGQMDTSTRINSWLDSSFKEEKTDAGYHVECMKPRMGFGWHINKGVACNVCVERWAWERRVQRMTVKEDEKGGKSWGMRQVKIEGAEVVNLTLPKLPESIVKTEETGCGGILVEGDEEVDVRSGFKTALLDGGPNLIDLTGDDTEADNGGIQELRPVLSSGGMQEYREHSDKGAKPTLQQTSTRSDLASTPMIKSTKICPKNEDVQATQHKYSPTTEATETRRTRRRLPQDNIFEGNFSVSEASETIDLFTASMKEFSSIQCDIFQSLTLFMQVYADNFMDGNAGARQKAR